MPTLRAAIIGLGPNSPGKGGAHSFGYAHATAYASLDGVELVAAATRTPKNLADFQAEFPGVAGYRDYRKMLENEAVDLVSICAWPPDRETMAMAALAAGAKGVWAEKPFALSLGAARRMMDAAQRAGARLFVNHQRRYGEPFAWFRDAVQHERIGAPMSIDIAMPFASALDFLPHLIDAALFAIGPAPAQRILGALDLRSTLNAHGAPVEQAAIATVHFDGGVRLCIETPCNGLRLPILRANGSDGFAELHLEPREGMAGIFRARYRGQAAVANPATCEGFHHSDDPNLYVRRAGADIIRVLKEGGETLIEAGEALRGMHIIAGLFESSRRAAAVDLPLPDGEFSVTQS